MPDCILPRTDHAQIVPFDAAAHAAGVLAVADECLGSGYLGDLSPLLARPGLVFGVAVDAGLDGCGPGSVAGFIFGWRLGPGDLDALHPELRGTERPPELARAEAAGRLGIVKTLAVAPSRQGRGLGRHLFAECVVRLSLDGAEALVTPAWTLDGRPKVGHLLDHQGFTPWTDLPRPWAADCDAGAFACPARTHICACGLRMYAKLCGPRR